MNLKLESKKNIAQDIANQYAKYIELGVLRGGEKLPSCRDLAVQLKINPNTVQHAYTLLEERGHIITLPHKGSFVKEIEGSVVPDNISLVEHAVQQIKALKIAGLTFEQLAEAAKGVYFNFDMHITQTLTTNHQSLITNKEATKNNDTN